ncbi:MAG: hypothetical protein AB7F23_05985 [Phycisphaerae bacterium]|jgi:hypothetical protein
MKNVIAVLLLAAPLYAIGISQEARSFDDYSLLYENNIFSRERQAPVAERDEREPVRVRRVINVFILKGVAVSAQESVAFVEEQVSGDFYRLKAGDELAGGVVTDVQKDKIVFAMDNNLSEIAVGGELGRSETEEEYAASADAPDSSTKDTAATDAPAAGGASEDDILRLMLERRKQQMGN